MPYRVEYGPATPQQYNKKKHPYRLQIMTAACFLMFSFAVRQLFPSGVDKLRALILPDEPTVTQTALTGFMGDLCNGESLGDSFTAFCVYIIDHDTTLSG